MAPRAGFTAAEWARLLTVCVALLFEGMSLSSVNVQVPLIVADLRLSPVGAQLTVSSFLVVVAGGLLAASRCADRYGRRRVFVLGVFLFGVGALTAALATSAALLISGRICQGAGATLSLPAAVAIVTTSFREGRSRARALGVYSAMGAAGFSLGLVVTGVVAGTLGWRWGFGVYVPLAVLTGLVAFTAVPADGPAERQASVDWLGVVAGTAGLMSLTDALAALPDTDEAVSTITAGGFGAGCLVVFALRQRTAREPLVPREVFRAPGTQLGGTVLLAAFGGIAASLYLVSSAVQDGLDYSALQTGVAFLPQGLAVALLSGPASRAVLRRGTVRVSVAGLACEAAGLTLFLTIGPGRPYLLTFFPASLLVGFGIAAVFPAATSAAVVDVPDRAHAAAAGAVVTCQQGGGAIGLALATAVAAGTTSLTAVPTWAMVLVVCYPLAGIVAVRLLALRARTRPRGRSAGNG